MGSPSPLPWREKPCRTAISLRWLARYEHRVRVKLTHQPHGAVSHLNPKLKRQKTHEGAFLRALFALVLIHKGKRTTVGLGNILEKAAQLYHRCSSDMAIEAEPCAISQRAPVGTDLPLDSKRHMLSNATFTPSGEAKPHSDNLADRNVREQLQSAPKPIRDSRHRPAWWPRR